MKHRFIVVEGPIGCGKTSLAKLLARRLNADVVLEEPESNPFLPLFYRDMRRHALSTQLFFLFQRLHQLEGLRQPDLFGRPTLADFALQKDPLFARLTLDDNEFISPKDADGHGTHIASVAAGNPVSATLGGEFVDKISGMAPRAHVAVYKACWLEPGELRGTCSTADLTQAIEDAIADGVDIINYSVGSDDDIVDADDLALLAAVNAGVLVVGAAGNEGPAPESVVSPAAAPWVLAVGASSRRGERYSCSRTFTEAP